MDINATNISYYLLFSLVLSVISYFLLSGDRKRPSADATIILLLTPIPPLPLIALFLFYLKPNKSNP